MSELGETTKFCDKLLNKLDLQLRIYDDNGHRVDDPHLHIGTEMAYINIISGIIVPLVRFLLKNPKWKFGE